MCLLLASHSQIHQDPSPAKCVQSPVKHICVLTVKHFLSVLSACSGVRHKGGLGWHSLGQNTFQNELTNLGRVSDTVLAGKTPREQEQPGAQL